MSWIHPFCPSCVVCISPNNSCVRLHSCPRTNPCDQSARAMLKQPVITHTCAGHAPGGNGDEEGLAVHDTHDEGYRIHHHHTHTQLRSSKQQQATACALWTVVVTCVRWWWHSHGHSPTPVCTANTVYERHDRLTDRDGPNDQYISIDMCCAPFSLQQCGHVRITYTHTAVTQACCPSPSRTCAHLHSHTKSKRQASWLLKRGFAFQTALHPLCCTAEAPLNASSSMSSPQKLPPPPLSMGQNILAGAFAGMSELCCM